jgi:hypothetical protein
MVRGRSGRYWDWVMVMPSVKGLVKGIWMMRGTALEREGGKAGLRPLLVLEKT